MLLFFYRTKSGSFQCHSQGSHGYRNGCFLGPCRAQQPEWSPFRLWGKWWKKWNLSSVQALFVGKQLEKKCWTVTVKYLQMLGKLLQKKKVSFCYLCLVSLIIRAMSCELPQLLSAVYMLYSLMFIASAAQATLCILVFRFGTGDMVTKRKLLTEWGQQALLNQHMWQTSSPIQNTMLRSELTTGLEVGHPVLPPASWLQSHVNIHFNQMYRWMFLYAV